MIVETDAIVLHTIKYSETSIIAYIYTEQFGKGTYIMNNVRTNRSKMAMFQPLSLVHITAYRKKDPAQIHRISSIAFTYVPNAGTTNVVKSTIKLFVGEMIHRIFAEEERFPDFYDYFKSFVLLLDNATTAYSNLHILFLLHLTKFLGVYPQENYAKETPVFSFRLAQFVAVDKEPDCLSEEYSKLLMKNLQTSGVTDDIQLTTSERQHMLRILLQYYDVHVCRTQSITSLEILTEIFE